AVSIKTPLGYATVFGSDAGISRLSLGELFVEAGDVPEVLKRAEKLLCSYFNGEKVDFSEIPLLLEGTPFQKRVWNALREVPYGEVRTYKWLAHRVGCGSSRAVGRALFANPVPIIVPCHRIVRKDGNIGGFSAGIRWKRYLLELEGWRPNP
ncbi:MAG: methylated-DNA--[protein]-cysteine S-methyltransferase, partial [Deferribacteres bacterium]|nr:methylated-DNA--[protein]-cysteine S-methyltransferase [Deferribacteres bacterium]